MKIIDLLDKVVTDNYIPPTKIYNMDESGQHVCIVISANAGGNFLLPAMIMPRKIFEFEYFDGALSRTLQLLYDSGYMIGDLFVKG